MKLQRIYQITIKPPDSPSIIITPPLTAKINVKRDVLSSANTIGLTIINLKKSTRNTIFKDRFSVSEYWQMIVEAGYGDRLYSIFKGNIYEAYSYKQGSEWYTKIDGMDGMYAIQNGVTSRTYSEGTDVQSIVNDVITDMPNTIAGTLSDTISGNTDRGVALFGQTTEILEGQTDGQYFIDNEQVNILGDNEVLASAGVIVLSNNIRFTTPRRRDSLLEIPTLFTPQISVGQLAEIRNSESVYNGQYKILGFTHDVTISQAEAGSANTKIILDAGSQALRAI